MFSGAEISGRRLTPLRQRGVALVLVIWVLALLTTMALAVAAIQRTDATLTRNALDLHKARALAEAGIYYAIARLNTKLDREDSWVPDGEPKVWQFVGHQVSVTISDEGGRIDLNKAEKELIDGLLQAAGLDEDQATSIRDAIFDWRDTDSEHRLNGVEDSAYGDFGKAYGAKDDLFDSTSELLLVPGITPALFRLIEPALTVFSTRKTVNPVYAPLGVLSSLPGLDPERLTDYLETRQDHAGRGVKAPLPAGIPNDLFHDAQGPVYRIAAVSDVGGGVAAGMEVVVRISSPGNGAYEVLARRYLSTEWAAVTPAQDDG